MKGLQARLVTAKYLQVAPLMVRFPELVKE
jgi:hypothetical protein